jgi:hypothetical protein
MPTLPSSARFVPEAMARREGSRGFLLPLAHAVFTSRSFCGVTIGVTPGLSTLWVARPLLYPKVLRRERFPLSFGLPS